MGKIVAVVNQKGGVGKTTVSGNLAKDFARKGRKVLIADNDPQGNATRAIFGDDLPDEVSEKFGESSSYCLYYEGSEVVPIQITDNLSIVGGSKHLSEMSTRQASEVGYEFKEKLEILAEEQDYVIIDCLPSFGTMLTAALITADYVLIPTLLDDFSINGIAELVSTVHTIKRRHNEKLKLLGIVVNQKDGREVLVEQHYLEELVKTYGDLVLKPAITKSVKVAEATAFQQSVYEYKPSLDQAKQFDSLSSEILKRMEK